MEREVGSHHQRFNDGSEFYKQGRLLGVGRNGHVHSVYSLQSFDTFARKSFKRPPIPRESQAASEHVAKEIKTLKRISHRHLIKFVGSYTDKDWIALLMKPVAESNLNEFLSQTPFPRQYYKQLRGSFGCLSVALHYLHQNEIKHQDLKPGNILITDEGKVLITDFGSATDFSQTGRSTMSGPEHEYTGKYAPREVIEHGVSLHNACDSSNFDPL